MLITRSIQHKIFSRLRIILSGGLSTFIRSFGNIIVALLVVRLFSDTFWGTFVFYLILIDLFFNVINWGNRSYLLREFSLKPDKIIELWQTSFTSRSLFFLIAVFVALLLPFSIYLKALFLIWGIGRYIYQSFEPVVAYQRDYTFSILTESAGYLIIILPLIFYHNKAVLNSLAFLYMISFIFKGIVSLIYYRKFIFSSLKIKISSSYLKRSIPFLLAGFSGILVSRADLYIVAAFLDASSIAQYQVFISLLLFGHFATSILITPFEKNIYRLKASSIRKLQRKMAGAGTLLSLLMIIAIYFIINYLFRFDLSLFLYISGAIYIYLFFLYLLRIYEFAKAKKQQVITAVTFAGGAINIILSLILIPIFDMEGAMVAAVMGQLFIALTLNIKDPTSNKKSYEK